MIGPPSKGPRGLEPGARRVEELSEALARAREALAAAEERYETVAAALETERVRFDMACQVSDSGMWEWDADQMPRWSPRLRKLIGFGPADPLPTLAQFLDRIHPDDRDTYVKSRDVLRQKGTLQRLEVRLRVGTGQHRWFRMTGQELPSGQRGGDVRVVGLVSDIHEHKLAELALRDSEQRFRALFEGASMAVTLRDAGDQRLLDANLAAVRLYGYSTREELIDKSVLELSADEQPGGTPTPVAAPAVIARVLADKHVRVEWLARRRDGEVFPSEIDITLIETGDGRRLMQSVITDTSVRKATEESLARAREEAVAASLTKSMFLANMSHELRTPLNGVIGMVGLLGGTALDARQRRYVEVAQTSANLLLSLIDQILDFSKIEAGKLQLEEVELSVEEIVAEVTTILARNAEEKSLRLTTACGAELHVPLMGDPTRIRQILVNLVSNAIKFTDSGEVSVTARALAGPGDALDVRVEVRDTGRGIPAEALPKLFRPFSQVDATATRAHGGSGLGLAICRELVERMGGRLGVRSEVGSGSTFWFELPLARSGRSPASERGSTPPVAAPPPSARDAAILLVEDSAVNVEVAAEILRGAGFRFEVVRDGAEAVSAVTARTYALVLMDCQLPVMDGYEATRRIRAMERADARPPVPIVALTASATAVDLERCLAAGMDGRVSKPIDPRRLLAELARRTGRAPATVRSSVFPPRAPLERALQRLQGNRELLGRIVEQFRVEAARARDALAVALAGRDAPGLLFAAHRLRGQAASLDAQLVVDALEQVEVATRAGSWSDVVEALALVGSELDAFLGGVALDR